MSKLVTLDEIEEYNAEVRRAHAEGRAPALKHPQEVYAENLGNAESHLVELTKGEQTTATRKLRRQWAEDQKQDDTIRGVIRGNIQAPSMGEGNVGPYDPPDPSKYRAPKTKTEKETADRTVDHLMDNGAKLHDSFSSANIPNLTKEGLVQGDSVNRKLTRKEDPAESPVEEIMANEAMRVPVPERFRHQNPPQVVQQGNPLTGEAPTPESSEQHWYQLSENADETNPSTDTVPHTAISVPVPNHVVGDETGTTREKSRTEDRDQKKAKETGDFPVTVPMSQSQVAQGAVKRPENMDLGRGSLPLDAPDSFRPEENQAQVAAEEVSLIDTVISEDEETARNDQLVADREAGLDADANSRPTPRRAAKKTAKKTTAAKKATSTKSKSTKK